MNYKAALFDMDGVILDSEPLHLTAFKETLRGYGKNLSDEEYVQYFAGRTDKAGFLLYFNVLSEAVDIPKIMDEKAQNYLQLVSDGFVAYPGVVEVIKRLAEQIPISLVTGSLRIEAQTALGALGIIDCFQTIVCAEDVKFSKPNPEGYLKASLSLGVGKRSCVVVEDAPSGVSAAQRAGMDCIAVTHTHSADELSDATVIVDNLTIDLF